MSTLEKLFVQIFEEKQRIIDRVKHQTHLFDQHLASKLLIDGIAPPPWLWTHPLYPQPSDLKELNKEQLLPEVLLPQPPPTITYSNSHCSLYNKPIFASDNGQLPNELHTQVHASDKGLDAGDGPSSLHPEDAGCASSVVTELDQTAMSPQGPRDMGVPDICHDQSLSLARIHRSKSRQRAIELRNSTKAANSCLNNENNVDTFAGGISESAIASLQNEPDDESVFVNPMESMTARFTEKGAKVGDCRSMGYDTYIYSGEMTRSISTSQQLCSINVNKSYISGEDGGILTGSAANLNGQSGHENELLELVEPTGITNQSCGGRKAKRGDDLRKDMGSNVYLGRVTRSRNSSELRCLSKSINLDRSCDNNKADELSDSKQPCIYADESMELVKPSAISIDRSRFKEILVDCQSKEEGCNAYFERGLRSRSSRQSFDNVNGTVQAQSMRKSSKLHQSPSCIGDAAFKNGQGPQMYDARSSMSQQEQDLCGENAREHSSKADSEVKCVARYTESQATSNIKIIPKAVYSNAYNQRVTRSRFAASSKSNEIQGAQMSTGRSSPSPKDQDPCPINATCYLDKENVADAFAAKDIKKGEMTSTSEGISRPLKSSHALGCKVTHCRSNASNKPPFAQSINISEGIDLKKGPGTQTKVLPCIGNNDTIGLERCATNMIESEIYSDEFIDASSGCPPGSNMDIACVRVGSDVLVLRPSLDCKMFIKPKQLNFVDVDGSGLNGISCPASEKEMRGRSSEAFANPAELMDKVAFVSDQARCSSSPGKHLPEEQEDLSNENKPQESSSKVHVEETYESSGFSDGNAVPLLKKPSEVPKDAVTYTLPESGRIHQEKSFLVDNSSISGVACEDSIRRLPKVMNSSISNGSVDTMMDLSYEKVVVEHDDRQSTKLVSEDDKVDSGLCGDPKNSTDANFAIVSGFSLFNNLDVSLTNSTVDIACPLLVDEMEDDLVQQIIHSANSQNGNADSLGRCVNEDKFVVGLKSAEDEIANIAMPRCSFSLGSEDLGHQHKRRKIEGQLTSVPSASFGLREEGVDLISKDSISENLNDAEDNPEAVLDSQDISSSLEEGIAQLGISKSLVEEMHENEGHIVERSESSPRLQVDEVQLSLEAIGGSASTPFTYIEDGLRMSFISSLINQAAGDSQGCLTEAMEVANLNSKIFDSRQQCFVDQIPLEDKLGLESTEHFTCSERTLQENISKFEGPKFSGCSVSSPCSHSLDMTGADEAVPVFEGFILQADEKQPCITGDEFNFEKFDLPNTDIERASILEQLCRSACMNTPLSCSSAVCKLHTIPSLYNSVPNGLLEGMNLRSNVFTNDTGKQSHSFCANEEVGRTFHGRSYSDCPPNSSCQSDWNIRNPFTSPVRKLWDRIKSNSGSSEKRTSLNPELPCINEENENADEVAEIIPEGIYSEVTTSSAKRVPLLDITENPNPPASVSEVEMYADRCSLDSVNMEFSFTGTHTRVKQKLTNQHSRKKRYVNKPKESQSVSIGVNSFKKATEPVRDRFTKPKLSGKTSMRKGSPTFLGRESKPNNIVSNITSFIPLVQQKQAATAITGKRDIKVKALEAAEAAKRLAEKKENERKMKKEALKLERTRLGQENLRQLVLQKQRKEEEKKKKEAGMAAKKRQREEEERKEKERKRKRVEDSRRRQLEHEKLCGEKEERELKHRATDTRKDETKELKDETDIHKKMESIREADNPGKVSETEHRTARIPSSDARKESTLKDSEALSNGGNNSKVTSSLNKVIESDNVFTNTKPEQSYDISPYKVSDDEDEDEDDDDDDALNSKFIPSWASKHRVGLVISSQQRVDPEAIFPPESFCNITEVLLPRELQLK